MQHKAQSSITKHSWTEGCAQCAETSNLGHFPHSELWNFTNWPAKFGQILHRNLWAYNYFPVHFNK